MLHADSVIGASHGRRTLDAVRFYCETLFRDGRTTDIYGRARYELGAIAER